jgi:hypothetical protein
MVGRTSSMMASVLDGFTQRIRAGWSKQPESM